MKKLAALAGIFVLAAALPALAGDRETIYSADNYTVYREDVDYCTLYLDTPEGSMVRISYRNTNSAVFFMYVRDTMPDLPDDLNIWFRYDNATAWEIYKAVPYSEADHFDDGNRVGFSMGADKAMLGDWANHNEVKIGTGDPLGSGFETIRLKGAQSAIKALLACPSSPQS